MAACRRRTVWGPQERGTGKNQTANPSLTIVCTPDFFLIKKTHKKWGVFLSDITFVKFPDIDWFVCHLI